MYVALTDGNIITLIILQLSKMQVHILLLLYKIQPNGCKIRLLSLKSQTSPIRTISLRISFPKQPSVTCLQNELKRRLQVNFTIVIIEKCDYSCYKWAEQTQLLPVRQLELNQPPRRPISDVRLIGIPLKRTISLEGLVFDRRR